MDQCKTCDKIEVITETSGEAFFYCCFHDRAVNEIDQCEHYQREVGSDDE